MTHETFESVTQEQLTLCTDILCKKSKEYSSQEDKLHNFKNAAGLQGVTQIQALSGMMAKHTISIYDMCMSDKTFPVALWEEKITDSINYLLLLKAAVVEEQDKPTTEQSSSVEITPETLEELFRGYTNTTVEPAKGKYEGLSNFELDELFCSPTPCNKCPVLVRARELDISCNGFIVKHPEEFRKIAIDWLNKQDNKMEENT